MLRPVKSGLGGHDGGASGVDGGVEKSSIPISKRGRMAGSDHPTFSDFVWSNNEFASENQNDQDKTESPEDGDAHPSSSCFNHS